MRCGEKWVSLLHLVTDSPRLGGSRMHLSWQMGCHVSRDAPSQIFRWQVGDSPRLGGLRLFLSRRQKMNVLRLRLMWYDTVVGLCVAALIKNVGLVVSFF